MRLGAVFGGVAVLMAVVVSPATARETYVTGEQACSAQEQVVLLSQGYGETMFVRWGPLAQRESTDEREYFLGASAIKLFKTSTGEPSVRWTVEIKGVHPYIGTAEVTDARALCEKR
jgi:hypothetical protein